MAKSECFSAVLLAQGVDRVLVAQKAVEHFRAEFRTTLVEDVVLSETVNNLL